MSRRVINPNQLQMLMKPSEIRGMLKGSVDYVPTADPTRDWEGKAEDNKLGLNESVAKEGVRNPVIIDHWQQVRGEPVMGNGHHRVQAAKELEDSGKEIYVPVLHVEGDYMGWSAGEHFPSTRDY